MRPFGFSLALALVTALIGCASTISPSREDSGVVLDTPLTVVTDAAPALDTTSVVENVMADAGPEDAPFVMASHTDYPMVPDNGGPVLSAVKVVTITYASDPNAASDVALMQYLVTSSWLTTAGADYGVGAGTVIQNVTLPGPAPASTSNMEVENDIIEEINNGTVTSPPDYNFANYLYVVFYPSTTTITETVPGLPFPMTSCMSYGGYHSPVDSGAYHFAYAVIPDCGAGDGMTDAQGISVAASHELIESCTDPLVGTHTAYYLGLSEPSAWDLLSGGEVGDLCDQINVQQDGYLLQRVWSNTAAANNQDPCVPAPADTVGFNVSTHDTTVGATAGQQLQITLTGWSTAPIADWQLHVYGVPFGLSPTLSRDTINNGEQVTITVQVPSESLPDFGFGYGLVVESTRGDEVSQWPIAIAIQ